MFALRRSTAALNGRGNASLIKKQLKHTLPELPYPSNALEPVICSEIMELHYTKHHAAYVNNLNAAEEKLSVALKNQDISTAVSLLPQINFNGGGHINHSILWTILAPPSLSGQPSADLKCAIEADFGTLENMKEKLSSLAATVQGSGWAWLGICPNSKRLQLATCSNQDPLQSKTGLVPLFGIDVWEHAYYLQYKNNRVEYVKHIWEVANWKAISDRYSSAKNC